MPVVLLALLFSLQEDPMQPFPCYIAARLAHACLMNLWPNPTIAQGRTCTIHSNVKEEMAGVQRKPLSTMISSKYTVAFWTLLCMMSKACNNTLKCAVVLEGRQVLLHMDGYMGVLMNKIDTAD
jgi:hypothetical protein